MDNISIKYVGEEHADHLIHCLKENSKLTKDWTGNLYCGSTPTTGNLYCGITLMWDYIGRTLDISMPGYIKNNY